MEVEPELAYSKRKSARRFTLLEAPWSEMAQSRFKTLKGISRKIIVHLMRHLCTRENAKIWCDLIGV